MKKIVFFIRLPKTGGITIYVPTKLQYAKEEICLCNNITFSELIKNFNASLLNQLAEKRLKFL
jgi:hypothetical protein